MYSHHDDIKNPFIYFFYGYRWGTKEHNMGVRWGGGGVVVVGRGLGPPNILYYYFPSDVISILFGFMKNC